MHLCSNHTYNIKYHAESDDESDDEFHERLDRALRDGYVEIFTAKCGVSGPPG